MSDNVDFENEIKQNGITYREEFLNVAFYLSEIQLSLNVPKNRYNKFGNYAYRNCEDILDAVKKVMPSECSLVLTDNIELIGERYYVKATASFYHKDKAISSQAYARESLDKKGMDAAQITGSASSYARKYALNGLFAIDDSKDADEPEYKSHEDKKQTQQQSQKSVLISRDQELDLSEMLFRTQSDKDKFMDMFRVKSLSQLTLTQYEHAVNLLNKKTEKMQMDKDEAVKG